MRKSLSSSGSRAGQAIARQLWTMTGRELQRVQDHILLLIKSAKERVVGFLTAERAPAGNQVELPMTRHRRCRHDQIVAYAHRA